ncbi:MAG: hypothetical protein JST59_29710 [Actinobacteria bacterium]|nr:hypothetical protein [Actinomycetota bacterium]
MAGVEVDVSHAAISRALATLGERAGAAEVAGALSCDWEPFEAQMRRRMCCRARENRVAYLCLSRAGAERVRFHLEATGVIPRRPDSPRRSRGVSIRASDRRPRRRREAGPRRPGSQGPHRPVLRRGARVMQSMADTAAAGGSVPADPCTHRDVPPDDRETRP